MPTLAPKLPWTHPFAGGYPRLGGQPLPTDPDAIDYLNRVAAADGAAVEVGVAMAVDAFVRGCKADGIWSAIKASCIMCGARTISGALVPLVGAAPTAYSFASGDYDRSSGLKGDGSTKYLDSNRANNADPQNDKHISVYLTGSLGTSTFPIGDSTLPGRADIYFGDPDTTVRINGGSGQVVRPNPTSGLVGGSRNSADSFNAIISGTVVSQAGASSAPSGNNIAVFARNNGGVFDGRTASRLSWYSIGSALDLALLDNRVSTLVAAIAAAL